VIVAIAGVLHYVWQYDWAMIQWATRLQAVQDASDVEMTIGPSWREQLWSVVRFRIPPKGVPEFVEKNQC
jgi:hypothetical protein